MAFEPIFETININNRRGIIEGQIKAECKTDVSADTVSKVLNVSAFANAFCGDVASGEIKYGGRVVFYLSYVDVEGNVRKCECGNEFSGVLEEKGVSSACSALMDVNVDKTAVDHSGLKLSVTAYLTVKADVTECGEIRALSGGDNLISLEQEIPLVKSFGVREGVYPLEQEFELNYPVAEILSHRADAMVTSVQCGVGCIIVDGEVIITAIALQKNEKRDIIRECKTIPYRMEIECEEAMPSMQATARVVEKSFKTDVSVDEDGGKSIVSVSVNLQFQGEVFCLSNAKILTDVFSYNDEIEIVRESFPFRKVCDLRSCRSQVNGRATVDELPVGVVLMAVGGERAEILSAKSDGDVIKVSGVLSLIGYFRNGEGETFTEKMETPFETLLECSLGSEVDFDVKARAERASARIVSLTETEIEAELRFTVYPCEKGSVNYVKEIKCVGEKQREKSAISVYIPFEGEELWSLAKRLNVCPETLVETNRDLTFPLTGKERIIVYRQK